MLKTTCPPTCPLVWVLVLSILSGPKFDAIDHQNSGHDSHRYSSKPISVVKKPRKKSVEHSFCGKKL